MKDDNDKGMDREDRRLANMSRWAAMQAWRSARRKQLKARGALPNDAMAQAQREAQEKWAAGHTFEPMEVDEVEDVSDDEGESEAETPDPADSNGLTESDPVTAAAIDRLDASAPVDLVRDTLWVYQHISKESVGPIDAPSLGAWNMLVWARRSQGRFFEQMLPKAMAAKGKEKEEEEKLRENRLAVEEIGKVLGQFLELVKKD